MPTKTAKKKKCEIKSQRVCNDSCVRRFKGRLKDDPEFNCCIACLFELKRMGVKGIKEV